MLSSLILFHPPNLLHINRKGIKTISNLSCWNAIAEAQRMQSQKAMFSELDKV